MQDVTTIPVNCDYFFMREGIKPMWEDPANKGGCDFRAVVGRNMDTANMWKMAVSREGRLSGLGIATHHIALIVARRRGLPIHRSRVYHGSPVCPPQQQVSHRHLVCGGPA